MLAVLGVDLIWIAVLIAILLSRRAWISRQPGAFKGAVRVAEGEVPGFRPKWKHGFGRWVGDVLVWAKAPSLFPNELVAADGLAGDARTAGPDDKVKRLGHEPVIVPVAVSGARIEIAVAARTRDRAVGPFTGPVSGHQASEPKGRHAQSPRDR
ncbi:MAG: DUF2550 domain-containing protein [Actinomycetota bacterium]|nr:DUF2550 domain-containing protein [Actinomycetota bacterium]